MRASSRGGLRYRALATQERELVLRHCSPSVNEEGRQRPFVIASDGGSPFLALAIRSIRKETLVLDHS